MLTFVRTSFACPEEYDIFENKKKVGYMRYRWGKVTVYSPDVNGKVLISHKYGNEMSGLFEDQDTRDLFLDIASMAVADELGLYDDGRYSVIDDEKNYIDSL